MSKMQKIRWWFIINVHLIRCRYHVWTIRNICDRIDLWLYREAVENDDYEQRNVSLKRLSESKALVDKFNELIEFYETALIKIKRIEL